VARQAAGLRQADLAKRLQEPRSFVTKTETGERSLNVVESAIIAQAIGVDPLALFAVILEGLLPDAGQ
jgi:transcriptional regulator with XRE-family HTH domain